MFVIYPMKGKCHHVNENYNGDTVFWFHRPSVIFPLLVILINFFGSVLYMFNMLRVCGGQERLDCLLECHDHLLIINSIICLFLLGWKITKRAEELNYLSNILKNRNFFGFENFICGKCGRFVYSINHINIFGALGCIFIFGFASFAAKGTEIFNYHDICMFVCQGMQVTAAAIIIQKLILIRIIYRAVDRSIRQRFLSAYRRGKGRTSLEEDLRKIIHLYLDLKVVTDKICEFINPMALIWLTSHIALSVFNFYALVQVINIRAAHVIAFAQIKTTVKLMVLFSIFCDCQHILDQKGMDILNYHDFCMLVCNGIQVTIATQVSQKLVLIRIIYRAVYRSIRQRFNAAYGRECGRANMDQDLRKLIHLYLDLKVVTNKICEFIDPMVLIWLTSHIALSVFNIYAIVQSINVRPALLILLDQTKTMVQIMVMISIFTDCQHIVDQVRKLTGNSV
ncbi:hypothetical protein HHI36_000593 [Cryptolaemus montrouzieri]|uniref:Gustatory receptor n=1 Tax=Cryptolaemus montrouzieri TaxID=559131 RepID=A0ABD2P5G1_9CUCU